MVSDSEFAEEGEGAAEESIEKATSEPSSVGSKINPYSIRGRLKYAWRIIRNAGVADILTADPEEQIRNARAQQDYRWRGVYAFVLLIAMTAQIAFADWLFYRYLEKNDYEIDSPIFIAFFTSVVVEVIGLVLVVTQSLFPKTDKGTPTP